MLKNAVDRLPSESDGAIGGYASLFFQIDNSRSNVQWIFRTFFFLLLFVSILLLNILFVRGD